MPRDVSGHFTTGTRYTAQFGAAIGSGSEMFYDGVGNLKSHTVPGTSYGGSTSYTLDTRDELTQESTTRNGGATNNSSLPACGGGLRARPMGGGGSPRIARIQEPEVGPRKRLERGYGGVFDTAGNFLTFKGADPTNGAGYNADNQNGSTSYGWGQSGSPPPGAELPAPTTRKRD